MKPYIVFLANVMLVCLTPATVRAETVWLDDLNLSVATQGWGTPHKNQSVEGHMLTISGKHFEHGFGTHAESYLTINLAGKAAKFSASVGVDDEINGNPAASVEFYVVGDGRELWKSGVMHAGDTPKACVVDVSGVASLVLKVGDANDGNSFDHADWAEAKFESAEHTTFATSGEETSASVAPYILTPPAPASPRINGASVFGVRPGSPFLFTIPATGVRPMVFTAQNLPHGLRMDETTGQITGRLETKGEFMVTLRAKNKAGQAERRFRIVCGDQIALTPPMGWNSWNCFAGEVSETRVKSAADALVKSGLIHHGWTYVNVDDYWQNNHGSKDPTLKGEFRDAHGNIVPNSRFPDMKGLADYIHHLGLKAGLYSSPGPWTCGNCTGSFDHEWQDAADYANWGFDYLKYDWCSYAPEMESRRGNSTNYPTSSKSWSGSHPVKEAELIKPYVIMHDALAVQKRDIVFSLCQYGMGDVWKWGGEAGGNCWRTTGDITDTWRSLSSIGFHQDRAAAFAKPGNWNDPDMLIVGEVGWGNLHKTRLTVDEQYTHISLWCLLSAPLLIGCDLERLDDFTLGLLSNDEVIAVDQDPLGKEAVCVIQEGNLRVYKKELEDGGRALGFFNLGATRADLNFDKFEALGITGKQLVRDLWRQKNVATLDTTKGPLPLSLPAHGVMLLKLSAVSSAVGHF